MSWYRTYRPQTISQLHLPVVRDALERIRKSGSFGHAYLFTGPKGTGKTSGARILAKLLNCTKNEKLVDQVLSSKNHKADKEFSEPCGVCKSCQHIADGNSFCVVEMDAASNRGIDDIRSLRERVHLTPTDGKISVYIIDEVHMLTTEAFNALLKVLEEPPAHVVFALATTELHKVPETIVSRCTVIQSQKAKKEHIFAALEHILHEEKITTERSVLEEIARRADGSFRDAVKLLENIAQGKTSLQKGDAEALGGLGANVVELFSALCDKNVDKVSAIFQEYELSDTDMIYVQKTLLLYIHEQMLFAMESDKSIVRMYMQMMDALNTPLQATLSVPYLSFELACMEWCLGDMARDVAPVQNHIQTSVPVQQSKTQPKVEPKIEPRIQPNDPVIKSAATSILLSIEQVMEQWQNILKETKQNNATLEALLRAARPKEIQGDKVIIEVFYSFHKEQLEHDKYRRTLEKVIGVVCKTDIVKLSFVLGKKPPKETVQPKEVSPQEQQKDAELTKAAEEVFAA